MELRNEQRMEAVVLLPPRTTTKGGGARRAPDGSTVTHTSCIPGRADPLSTGYRRTTGVQEA
jgi:hypothetical protein